MSSAATLLAYLISLFRMNPSTSSTIGHVLRIISHDSKAIDIHTVNSHCIEIFKAIVIRRALKLSAIWYFCERFVSVLFVVGCAGELITLPRDTKTNREASF